MKLSMDDTFEKVLHQSIQLYARNNLVKFEVLTPTGSSVFQIFLRRHQWAWSMEIFLHGLIQSYSWNSPAKSEV